LIDWKMTLMEKSRFIRNGGKGLSRVISARFRNFGLTRQNQSSAQTPVRLTSKSSSSRVVGTWYSASFCSPVFGK